MAEDRTDVELFVYQLREAAVYTVVVYGQEYWFDREGITHCRPGEKSHGTFVKRELIGRAKKSSQEMKVHIQSLSSRYNKGTYHMLQNNCNDFSDDLCKFLTGKGIPKY